MFSVVVSCCQLSNNCQLSCTNSIFRDSSLPLTKSTSLYYKTDNMFRFRLPRCFVPLSSDTNTTMGVESAQIRYLFRFLWYFGDRLATCRRFVPHSKIRGDAPEHSCVHGARIPWPVEPRGDRFVNGAAAPVSAQAPTAAPYTERRQYGTELSARVLVHTYRTAAAPQPGFA